MSEDEDPYVAAELARAKAELERAQANHVRAETEQAREQREDTENRKRIADLVRAARVKIHPVGLAIMLVVGVVAILLVLRYV